MNTLALSLLPAAFVATNAFATFLPPNNLHLQDNVMFAPNMTQEEFNKITDDIVNLYKPLAKTHGGSLKVNKNWNDGTVNASASQFMWWWTVNMYGGLARRPEVTPDGYAMVVCHELGHLFGGFPFVMGWMADEGQADYFATQSCAHEIWKNQPEQNATFRDTTTPLVKEKCDASWASVEEQNLCYRTAAAGQSLANLLAVLEEGPVPNVETPDTHVVSSTDHNHPAAQCRLDTYLSGSLCTANFDMTVVPGRKVSGGNEGMEAERAAAKSSCMTSGNFTVGLRPTCWFKPRM